MPQQICDLARSKAIFGAVSMVITAPSKIQIRICFVLQNLGTILGSAVVAGVAIYFVQNWGHMLGPFTFYVGVGSNRRRRFFVTFCKVGKNKHLRQNFLGYLFVHPKQQKKNAPAATLFGVILQQL